MNRSKPERVLFVFILGHESLKLGMTNSILLRREIVYNAPMTPEESHEQLKKVRETCLVSAEALLSTAERELGKGVDPICFHLALLALEEIGMLTLSTINHMSQTARTGKEEFATDEHIRKLFWALWGGGLMRKTKWTKESIEQNRHLATTLHDRRLETLYTDPKNPLPFGDRAKEGEAKMVVEFVRPRLELEKLSELTSFELGDVEEITWFFSSVEDPEKRKQIFSSVSLAKLAEFNNGKEWIKWLRETYRKNEEEMREYAQKEMRRAKPEGEEAMAPKYRMRVRIQTPSHSIRNNAFAEWNKNVNWIKINKSKDKDVVKLTKGEMVIELTLVKGLHTSYVWEHGLFMTKLVVISFNIGTLGVFWWHVHKDIWTYYEDIVDLEADPNGSMKLRVAPPKRLHVGFDEARWVLDQQAVSNVFGVLTIFLRDFEKIGEFINEYSMGLTTFSKTDIHLRMEANAFEAFYKALKVAGKFFGDWDGKSDFLAVIKIQLAKIKDMKELEETFALAKALEEDERRQKHHPITLTEVIAMKLYCDVYVQLKAKEYFEKLKDNDDVPQDLPHDEPAAGEEPKKQ